jgi:hypothetical protein
MPLAIDRDVEIDLGQALDHGHFDPMVILSLGVVALSALFIAVMVAVIIA